MGERQTMADRSVATTDTLETMRATFNSTAGDVGDISTLNNAFTGTPTDLVEGANKNLTSIGTIADLNNAFTGTPTDLVESCNKNLTSIGNITDLNNSFTGTPTDLVEAVNSKATQGFSVAMAVALG